MYLCCDLGGTNAHWGVYNPENQAIIFQVSVKTAEYDDFYQLLEHFLDQFKKFDTHNERIKNTTLALAGPTRKRVVRITNIEGWDVDLEMVSGILSDYGHDEFVTVINDFEALGYGVMQLLGVGLTRDDYEPIYGRFRTGPARQGQELGTRSLVCGPGTGLGIACIAEGLARDGFPVVLSSEGGHHSMPPETVDQYRYLARAGKFFGKKSYEETVSGPGLRNVYNFFRREDYNEEPVYSISSEKIVELSKTGKDQAATDAVEFLCEALACFCGNMVLTFNCDRAVFLWGGVLTDLSIDLLQGRFKRHFADRCNHSDIVSNIPVVLIKNPNLALLGCAFCSQHEDLQRGI